MKTGLRVYMGHMKPLFSVVIIAVSSGYFSALTRLFSYNLREIASVPNRLADGSATL